MQNDFQKYAYKMSNDVITPSANFFKIIFSINEKIINFLQKIILNIIKYDYNKELISYNIILLIRNSHEIFHNVNSILLP